MNTHLTFSRKMKTWTRLLKLPHIYSSNGLLLLYCLNVVQAHAKPATKTSTNHMDFWHSIPTLLISHSCLNLVDISPVRYLILSKIRWHGDSKHPKKALYSHWHAKLATIAWFRKTKIGKVGELSRWWCRLRKSLLWRNKSVFFWFYGSNLHAHMFSFGR